MDSYDRNESEQSMHFENQIDFSTYSEHVVCCSTRSCNIWTTVHFPITEFISITSSNFMCGFCQARINCSRPMCISNYTQTSFTTESCCDSSIKMDSTRNSNCSEMQTRTSDLQTTNVSILKTESSSLEKVSNQPNNAGLSLQSRARRPPFYTYRMFFFEMPMCIKVANLFPGEKDSSARKRRSRRGSRMLKSADDSPMYIRNYQSKTVTFFLMYFVSMIAQSSNYEKRFPLVEFR
ncbi:hypothetical protein GJ496_005477 [Pomphorhynchus laevis]|nr:hypothetical protein GJ496_005477 [Pomphorhynchus laevis]